MKNHPKEERTLVVVKPDGVQRSLVGEIIKRYERMGLKLVGIKMLVPTPEFVEKHYTLDPEWRRITGEKRIKAAKEKGEKLWTDDPQEITKIVLEKLKKYLSSGPVIALVWQGAHSVELVRKITGGTEPRSSDVGTIRGDFVLDSYIMADEDGRAVRNLIHASGTIGEAEKEIDHWFKPEEIINYRLIQEQILYDVNLDGLLE
ncbi:MAG: Nucleoside diphosphate kinase [Candidatus Woesebacteria bacterium GW2011_GWA1_39_8]|uniref:nucleoside-diphosphate kinase n=1 Tax=Candidatus Woesebacteria bacterium GW2011_GWA1_39_8 TaxID=1618552 RepID=A0A0G0PNS4_9BACT|nr:MAG: Nucleoside diphosphate kinase [Candidatus Woesebacteria bacterium GW2011_GWA1_39_8]